MKKLVATLLLSLGLLTTATAQALSLADFTQSQATSSVRQLLEQGSELAINQLGKQGGFSNSPEWRIPLPANLQKPADWMRRLGQGKYVTQLEDSLNAAAEQAVPHARELFVHSISQLTIADAKNIISGQPTAATDFLRRTSETELRNRFLPIVKQQTSKTALVEHYNTAAKKARKFGFDQKKTQPIEEYVTDQAIDSLFALLGEHETSLRANPQQAASNLLKQILGAGK